MIDMTVLKANVQLLETAVTTGDRRQAWGALVLLTSVVEAMKKLMPPRED